MKFVSVEYRRGLFGITLVELLVAMTIGLFLTAGILSLLVGTRQSYRTNDAIAEVQETGRFLSGFLGFELRQVGNLGCQRRMFLEAHVPEGGVYDAGNEMPIMSVLDINLPAAVDYSLDDWVLDFVHAKWLEAFDGTGTSFDPASPVAIDGQQISGVQIRDDLSNVDSESDVLVVRRVIEPSVRNNRVLRPIDVLPRVEIDGDSMFQEGDIALVSDCNSAAIFQVTNDDPNESEYLDYSSGTDEEPGNSSTPADTDELKRLINLTVLNTPPEAVDQNGEAFVVSTRIFYINDDSESPRLFMKEGRADGQAIADNVFLFQTAFGVSLFNDGASPYPSNNEDTPGIDTYVTPSQLSTVSLPAEVDNLSKRWDRVNAVRVSFVVGSSEDNVVDRPMTIALPGFAGQSEFQASDRRYYQAFSTTVFLRNKLPRVVF